MEEDSSEDAIGLSVCGGTPCFCDVLLFFFVVVSAAGLEGVVESLSVDCSSVDSDAFDTVA